MSKDKSQTGGKEEEEEKTKKVAWREENGR